MTSAPRNLRRWRWGMILMAIPVILFVIVSLAHWFNDPHLSEVGRLTRRHAGWAGVGAIDCGRVFGGDCPTDLQKLEQSAACAVTAYKEGNPFMFQATGCGIDTTNEYVLMGTRVGDVFDVYQMTNGTSKNIGEAKWSTWPRSNDNESKIRDWIMRYK